MSFWARAIPERPLAGFLGRSSPAALLGPLAVGVAAAIVVMLAGCGNGVASPTSLQTAAPSVPSASAFGPQLGYLWLASDRTLRPILGIPGASQVGESVLPAGLYLGAATSATESIALLQAADGSLSLMKLPSGATASLGIHMPVGATLRLSSSAASALAFIPGTTSAVLITNLTTTPRSQTIAGPAAITDAAVSDTGTLAIESSRGVTVIANNGSPVMIAGLGAPGGISFLPNGPASHDDLLFADSGANTVTLIRSSTTAPAAQSVVAPGMLAAPSAVGVSSSGRWALVANSGNQKLVRIDLSTLAVVPISCTCQPTLAEPLADDGAFRITALAAGANFLVDAAASTPRTRFIPALPASPNPSLVASTARP